MEYNNEQQNEQITEASINLFAVSTVFALGFLTAKLFSKNKVNKAYCDGIADGIKLVIKSIEHDK